MVEKGHHKQRTRSNRQLQPFKLISFSCDDRIDLVERRFELAWTGQFIVILRRSHREAKSLLRDFDEAHPTEFFKTPKTMKINTFRCGERQTVFIQSTGER